MPSISITSLCSYAELQESSISRLSWSFVKEFAVSSYRWSYAQLCILTRDKTTVMRAVTYTPGWGVGLVKSLNQVGVGGGGAGAGVESYVPYIFLNEIQTMLSQLAKRSARVLPADLCTDNAHYVKNHRSTVHSRPRWLRVWKCARNLSPLHAQKSSGSRLRFW